MTCRMQVMSANRFSALLDSTLLDASAAMLCYGDIFVGSCCCTSNFSRSGMLLLLRFTLRFSPSISRPGKFDKSASKTNYKLHIEVVVSLGPMRPLKWPGNAFLCVECLSVNVIITDLRCFPTSLTAVWNLKFEILVRVFETEIRWASQRAYFCWLLIPASKVIC